MTSVLFEARLSNPLSANTTHFSCILFGADSLAQKEERFSVDVSTALPLPLHRWPGDHSAVDATQPHSHSSG